MTYSEYRVSLFKNFYGGADVKYAVGLNDGNDGGFTVAPRLAYIINNKFPVYLGYRFISLDEDLGAIQFGVGYILNYTYILIANKLGIFGTYW